MNDLNSFATWTTHISLGKYMSEIWWIFQVNERGGSPQTDKTNTQHTHQHSIIQLYTFHSGRAGVWAQRCVHTVNASHKGRWLLIEEYTHPHQTRLNVHTVFLHAYTLYARNNAKMMCASGPARVYKRRACTRDPVEMRTRPSGQSASK